MPFNFSHYVRTTLGSAASGHIVSLFLRRNNDADHCDRLNENAHTQKDAQTQSYNDFPSELIQPVLANVSRPGQFQEPFPSAAARRRGGRALNRARVGGMPRPATRTAGPRAHTPRCQTGLDLGLGDAGAEVTPHGPPRDAGLEPDRSRRGPAAKPRAPLSRALHANPSRTRRAEVLRGRSPIVPTPSPWRPEGSARAGSGRRGEGPAAGAPTRSRR